MVNVFIKSMSFLQTWSFNVHSLKGTTDTRPDLCQFLCCCKIILFCYLYCSFSLSLSVPSVIRPSCHLSKMQIRNMADNVPSLKHGGAFWFTDLTTPDSMYIFPVLTALTFWITVEVSCPFVHFGVWCLHLLYLLIFSNKSCCLYLDIFTPM